MKRSMLFLFLVVLGVSLSASSDDVSVVSSVIPGSPARKLVQRATRTAPKSMNAAEESKSDSDDDDKLLDIVRFRASMTPEKAKKIAPDVAPNVSGRAQQVMVPEPLVPSSIAPEVKDDAIVVSQPRKRRPTRIGLKLSNKDASYRFTGLEGLTLDQRNVISTAFSSYAPQQWRDSGSWGSVLTALEEAGIALSDTAKSYLSEYKRAKVALLQQINSTSGEDVARGGERFVPEVEERHVEPVESVPTAADVVVASTVSPVIAAVVDNIIPDDTRRAISVGTFGSGDRLRFNLKSLNLNQRRAFDAALKEANPLQVLSDAGFTLTHKAKKIIKKTMAAQGVESRSVFAPVLLPHSLSDSPAMDDGVSGSSLLMQPQTGADTVLSGLGISQDEGFRLAQQLFAVQPTGGEVVQPLAGVRFSKEQYAALGALFNYLKMEQERAVREGALVETGQAAVYELPVIRLVATDGKTFTLAGLNPISAKWLNTTLVNFGRLEEQSHQAALVGYRGQAPVAVQSPLALEDGSSSVNSSLPLSIPRPISGAFREFIYPQMTSEEQARVNDHAPHLLAVDSQEPEEEVSASPAAEKDNFEQSVLSDKGVLSANVATEPENSKEAVVLPFDLAPGFETSPSVLRPIKEWGNADQDSFKDAASQSNSPTNVTAPGLDDVVSGGNEPNSAKPNDVADVTAVDNNVGNNANAGDKTPPVLTNDAISTMQSEKKDYSKWEVGGGALGLALATAIFKSVSPAERGALFSRLKSRFTPLKSDTPLTRKEKWAALRVLGALAAAAVATVATGHGLYTMATKKNEAAAGN